jgi:hypothetical protein
MAPLRYALTLIVLLLVASPLPVAAQTRPVWYRATDSLAVLDTGVNGAFAYALVRDSAMRGHNVFYLSVGAHVGALRVTRIDDNGVLLSNGRRLPNQHLGIDAALAAARPE